LRLLGCLFLVGHFKNMAAIETFEKELLALIGKPTDLRPFVCNGSPLQCQAFIVGFNPATALAADFWQFWHPGHGFDKAAWFAAYVKERQLRPLKPGKTRRNTISNTRRVIEWVLEGVSPVTCLETNIYASPTEQAVDLASKQRVTAPFDFLLSTINPRVIVVHGADAAAHIQSKSVRARIITVSHFSRGWSQVAARSLGQQIRSECNAQQGAPAAPRPQSALVSESSAPGAVG